MELIRKRRLNVAIGEVWRLLKNSQAIKTLNGPKEFYLLLFHDVLTCELEIKFEGLSIRASQYPNIDIKSVQYVFMDRNDNYELDLNGTIKDVPQSTYTGDGDAWNSGDILVYIPFVEITSGWE